MYITKLLENVLTVMWCSNLDGIRANTAAPEQPRFNTSALKLSVLCVF